MANLSNFDAATVEPAVGLDTIPGGKYPAIITESEMKPTKAGTGKYLQLTFQIIDGQFKGRKVWARLNLENPSDEAVRIARGELSAICRAVNVMAPKDSVELHNLPLTINIGIQKRKDLPGEFSNVLKGYEKNGATVAPAATPAGGTSTAPWKKTP